jgi:hypothetical protein
VAALISASAALALIAYAWLQFETYARARIDASIALISQKIGAPIEIGGVEFSPSGAQLVDIRIGDESQMVISSLGVEINVNPLDSDFAEIRSVSVADMRIKTQKQRLGAALSPVKGSFSFAERSEDARRFIEKFFAALPSRELSMGSVGITLLASDGEPMMTVQGLKVAIEREHSRVLFRVQEIKTRTGLGEKDLLARFELSPDAKDYRFFIRRKLSSNQNANAWDLTGIMQKDLSSAEITLDLHKTPSFLTPVMKELPFTLEELRGHAVIDLHRSDDHWQFTAQIQSQGSTVKIPIVSSTAVGPIYFDSQLVGSWTPTGRLLTITSANIKMPDASTKNYGPNPLQIALNGSWQVGSQSEVGHIFNAHWQLAKSSCQTALLAAPPGLLPALTGFKLSGDLAASLDLSVKTHSLSETYFSLHDNLFSCKVEEAPYAYSVERLNGPFSIKRQGSKNSPPVYIEVNPSSPSYSELSRISRYINSTFIASEDASFFHHKGIDPNAIENALRRDLSEQRIALGGSTITMQTVKNLFLTHERTLSRKLQELFLAWHLEQILTKQRILEIYVNIVELGPGIYGVTDASRKFFGKGPDDLNLTEAAYLANLLPSPKIRYRYFCQGRITENFRDLVNGLLKRMVNLRHITAERFLQAVATPIRFNHDARLTSPDCSVKTVDASQSVP